MGIETIEVFSVYLDLLHWGKQFIDNFTAAGDLKTKGKIFNKKWLVCLEFISVKLFNSYLPSHRGRSHEGRYCVLNLIWLVILLIYE